VPAAEDVQRPQAVQLRARQAGLGVGAGSVVEQQLDQGSTRGAAVDHVLLKALELTARFQQVIELQKVPAAAAAAAAAPRGRHNHTKEF
jgi:hypothetical protein